MSELQHYGVLGMHWGIRKHRSSKKYPSSQDYLNVQDLRKKSLRELSNQELRSLNERQNLERNYKELNKTVVEKGKKEVSSLLKDIGKELAKDFIKTGVKGVIFPKK